MWLTYLADVLREAGLQVEEVDGWKRRGYRSQHMDDIRTITCHHTAPGIRSKKPRLSLPVIRDGRPGLSGPLAQLYLDRDGIWYTVAAGLCNHAGRSRSIDFTNPHAIGIEAEAAGDGWSEDWPDVQMTSYVAGCKALVLHLNLPIGAIRGHKETCEPEGRKSDPSFNMSKFRAKVREWQFPVDSDREEEDEVKLTDTVRLGPSSAKILGQTDHAMTLEETIALLTATNVQITRLTAELVEEIKGLREQIGDTK